VFGPLCGGVLAGAVYKGYITMLKGQVTSDSNPWATTSLGASSVTAALNVSQPVTNNASLAAPGSAEAGAANITAPGVGIAGAAGAVGAKAAQAAAKALPKLF
jgi:hypothetical protein